MGLKRLFVCGLLLCLPACNSIKSTGFQEVEVVTQPTMHAKCVLSNDRGSWKTDVPGKIVIKRSKSDLNVDCESHNFEGSRKFESGYAEAVASNMIIGGGPLGIAVESATGGLYDYEDLLTIPMKRRYAGMPSRLPRESHRSQDIKRFEDTPPTQAYPSEPLTFRRPDRVEATTMPDTLPQEGLVLPLPEEIQKKQREQAGKALAPLPPAMTGPGWMDLPPSTPARRARPPMVTPYAEPGSPLY